MKKLFLTAMVLTSGLAFGQAGINIHIGFPLPPVPPLIIKPVPICPPPVYVVPVRPPVVVAPCGPSYRPPIYRRGPNHQRGWNGYDGRKRHHGHHH